MSTVRYKETYMKQIKTDTLWEAMFIKNKLDSHVAVSHIPISDYQVNRDIKIIM
jgi:hypothetical protein